jgi:Hemerythrin HHE cation binding domain
MVSHLALDDLIESIHIRAMAQVFVARSLLRGTRAMRPQRAPRLVMYNNMKVPLNPQQARSSCFQSEAHSNVVAVDLIDVLEADHRDVELLLERYALAVLNYAQVGKVACSRTTADTSCPCSILRMEKTTDSESEQRRQLADTLIADMVKHALTEELYAYPLMRKVLPEGNAAINKDLREHLEIDNLLRDLEHAHKNQPDYEHIVRKINSAFTTHRSALQNKPYYCYLAPYANAVLFSCMRPQCLVELSVTLSAAAAH